MEKVNRPRKKYMPEFSDTGYSSDASFRWLVDKRKNFMTQAFEDFICDLYSKGFFIGEQKDKTISQISAPDLVQIARSFCATYHLKDRGIFLVNRKLKQNNKFRRHIIICRDEKEIPHTYSICGMLCADTEYQIEKKYTISELRTIIKKELMWHWCGRCVEKLVIWNSIVEGGR